MKKQVTRLLLIIMLAVLFVPLFSNSAYAIDSPPQSKIDEFMLYTTYPTYAPYYKTHDYWVTIYDGTILIHYTSNYPIEVRENGNIGININAIYYFCIVGGMGGIEEPKPSETNFNLGGKILNINNVIVYEANHNINGLYSEAPEINTRPTIDLPFYIMYSDPDYNFINLQSYENLPVFTFGAYNDIDKMEFDVNWYGYGNMKRYILQDGEWFLSETKLEGQNWNDTGLDRKIIMECNHSILDFTGETSLEPINFSSGQPPKIMGGSFDQEGYGVKFISPRNGFKDNSFLWRYQVWFRLPYDDIEGDKYVKDTVQLGFGGDYKEGTKQVDFSNMEIKTVDGRKVIEGNYTVSVGHDVGVNEVTFQAKRNNDEKYWSATLQTERLAGFVDEDGDGLDDRTGREDNNQENPWHYDDYNPDGNRPDRSQYGEDIIGTVSYYFDTLLYWLLSPFRLISEGLQSTLKIVTDTFGWAGNFANMIGGLFSFLPSEITGMITLAFTSLIVFTIIKVVRK